MRISELSQKTGVSLRSLRYYEEKGLITPTRKENGYREYSDSDVQWVETIQLFLSIGATTEELSTYLNCQATHESLGLNPATVIEFYERKLKSIHEQMKILQKAELHIEDRLKKWRQMNKSSKHVPVLSSVHQAGEAKHVLQKEVKGLSKG